MARIYGTRIIFEGEDPNKCTNSLKDNGTFNPFDPRYILAAKIRQTDKLIISIIME